MPDAQLQLPPHVARERGLTNMLRYASCWRYQSPSGCARLSRNRRWENNAANSRSSVVYSASVRGSAYIVSARIFRISWVAPLATRTSLVMTDLSQRGKVLRGMATFATAAHLIQGTCCHRNVEKTLTLSSDKRQRHKLKFERPSA